MSLVPRITERLLEALCPPSPFRDGVIGDLAEEFGRRTYADGPLAARRWYYGQAIASAPHLVAYWTTRASFGSWIGIIALGVGAMISARAITMALQIIVIMSLGVVPDSTGIVMAAWRDAREIYPLLTRAIIETPWLIGVAAGYLIARRFRDAPIAAAGAAAVTASTVAVIMVLRAGLPLVPEFWLNLAMWTTCMITGSAMFALRAAELPSSRVAE